MYHLSPSSALVAHVLGEDALRPLLADHRDHVHEHLDGVPQLLVLGVDGREDALVEGRLEYQLRQFTNQMVDDIPQKLSHSHHIYLVDPQTLLQPLGGHAQILQLVADAHEELVEEFPGGLGEEFGVGAEGVVGEEGALLRIDWDSIGQQQNTLMQLLLALPLHLQLPVPRTLGEVDHLLEVASCLVHLRHPHAHPPRLLHLRLPPVQVLQHVQALQVVVYLLLRRQWQLRQLQQDLAGGGMGVAKGTLADLQGLEEHLLALGGIVGLELFVGEAVVDGDGEGVVGAQVITQVVQ